MSGVRTRLLIMIIVIESMGARILDRTRLRIPVRSHQQPGPEPYLPLAAEFAIMII
jgi:hypothetical protein